MPRPSSTDVVAKKGKNPSTWRRDNGSVTGFIVLKCCLVLACARPLLTLSFCMQH
jgi:hypothetical protein